MKDLKSLQFDHDIKTRILTGGIAASSAILTAAIINIVRHMCDKKFDQVMLKSIGESMKNNNEFTIDF